MTAQINIDRDEISVFCRKWKIRELALFGSVLRRDFRQESDVDVLVTFEENDPWSLLDVVTMRDELIEIVGRPIDLVEKKAITNPYRRKRILDSCEVIHAA